MIWRMYMRLLRTHPRMAQAINTSVLFGSGDVIAQVVLEKRRTVDTYNPWRTGRYVGVGLLVAGPTMYTWYTSIDRVVTGGKLMAASKMVALDQLLFLPVYLASFICIMSMLRGETSEVLWTKLHRDYGHLLITSYKFWPMVQMFNFTVVPLHHRILLMNCVSIMWNTYLGWRAERK